MTHPSASIQTLIEASLSDQIDPDNRPEWPNFDPKTMKKVGILSPRLKRAVCFADSFAAWQPKNHDQEGRRYHNRDIAEAWRIIKEMIRQELGFKGTSDFTICGDWVISTNKT